MSDTSPGSTDGLADAFADVVVLELPGVAASFCGLTLLRLGARVIKVTDPSQPAHETLLPLVPGENDVPVSASFVASNHGKEIVTADIRTEEGRGMLGTLLASADVLIEEYAPGFLESLGWGYESLHERHPRLVVASISPFGQSGPYSDYLGGDLVASAMSGMVHLTGFPGREPVRMGADQALKIAGAEAAAGIAVALFARSVTGRGQWVDLAMRDAMVKAAVSSVTKYEYEGTVQDRVGIHWGVRDRPLQALWRCNDGWVTFVRRGGALGGRVNMATVQWLEEFGFDTGDLADVAWDDIDMGNDADRAVLDRLDALFGEMVATQSAATLFDEGLRRGMTIAPVTSAPEILANVHLEARGFWDTIVVGSQSYRVPRRFATSNSTIPGEVG